VNKIKKFVWVLKLIIFLAIPPVMVWIVFFLNAHKTFTYILQGIALFAIWMAISGVMWVFFEEA